MTASALNPLTFEELVERAEKALDGARAPARIAGWTRLLEVLRPLAGSGPAADDLVTGRTWFLTRVQIKDYQGVGPAIDMPFPSTPGITVLHGANGSGKSSITDAIDTSLRGAPQPATLTGSGGRTPLWERRHCGRDATRAHAQVTLTSGPDTLVLTSRIDADGTLAQRTATLDTGAGPQDVDLGAAGWASALAGHQPVVGYAALERRLQRADDLSKFLTPMLAFGGCVDTLTETLAERSATTRQAAAAAQQGRTAAQRAVDEVDRQHRRADASDLPAMEWPADDEEQQAWLARTGLTAAGEAPPEIDTAITGRTRTAAEKAVAVLDELEEAETSVRARLFGPLRELHSAGAGLSEPGDTCPVCGGSAAEWVTDLGAQLTDVTAIDLLDATTVRVIRAFGETIRTDVTPVVDALDRGLCDPGTASAARNVTDIAVAFAVRVRDEGPRATAETRIALRRAEEALRSEAWATVVAEAAERSDHHARWRIARRAAVAPLLEHWSDLPTVADVTVWDGARECLDVLQGQVRAQRADNLRDIASATVRDLMSDVDLTVKDLSVKKTKAAVGIVDTAGREVSLAMLSAGQRNALLLAPLLAVAQGGPFGFLVLDDPVHALDQMRIDKLARAMEVIAQHRRVVVLTHDERLVEHLQARSVDCESRTVKRDHTSGVVRAEPRAARWSVLVSDAHDVLATAARHRHGVTRSPDDLVRSLCRMAFDAGLRTLLVNAATAAKRDPRPDLNQLDATSAASTKKRITTVRTLHPSGTALTMAEGLVQPYLDDWNAAAHGNSVSSTATTAEIDAVHDACLALEAGP